MPMSRMLEQKLQSVQISPQSALVWRRLLTRVASLKPWEAQFPEALAVVNEERRGVEGSAVSQGSNVSTMSGVAPREAKGGDLRCTCFASCSPLLVSHDELRELSARFREAEQIYLPTRIDDPNRVPTLVESPKTWRPDSCFLDVGRTQCRYTRPMVILRNASCGQPESGIVWDDKFTKELLFISWRTAEGWCGVFLNQDGPCIMPAQHHFAVSSVNARACAGSRCRPPCRP